MANSSAGPMGKGNRTLKKYQSGQHEANAHLANVAADAHIMRYYQTATSDKQPATSAFGGRDSEHTNALPRHRLHSHSCGSSCSANSQHYLCYTHCGRLPDSQSTRLQGEPHKVNHQHEAALTAAQTVTPTFETFTSDKGHAHLRARGSRAP